jgi:hypothetical protein
MQGERPNLKDTIISEVEDVFLAGSHKEDNIVYARREVRKTTSFMYGTRYVTGSHRID